ncbi:MAG: hypothetical protein GY765_19780 [bacterium]|nr:hypothetical protein [bacterium]
MHIKKKAAFIIMILMGLVCVCASISHQGTVDINSISQQAAEKPAVSFNQNGVRSDIDFGKIPLYFISNKGQVNDRAKFYAKASRYTLWLTKGGLVFDSSRRVEEGKKRRGEQPDNGPGKSGLRDVWKFERDVSRLAFLDANTNPRMVAVEEATLKVNYFKGGDKSKWQGGVPTSMAVLYKSLYKNIDLKVYGLEKKIEYDWLVKPLGDPGLIKFQYENVKGSRLDEEGNLLIETEFGELMHKKPFSYQHAAAVGPRPVSPASRQAHASKNEQRIPVDVRFKKIAENTYGFEVGEYDTGRELIIDPVVLAYSTYLGGEDSDTARAIAVDAGGNVYVTGETYSSDFPVLNQYQTSQGSGDTGKDVFVTKLDPTKSGAASLLYSTYLGGTLCDWSCDIAVDASGNAYVTGYTESSDFPVLNQYQTFQYGDPYPDDAFVVKLDTTKSGTASLLYSTYLGGESGETSGGIAADAAGNAYVTGMTASSDFPTLNQYQTYQGSGDVYVTKLDTTKSGPASLLYSTCLGGTEWNTGQGIAVDAGGKVYVTGKTEEGFPMLNQYQTLQGKHDLFVAKLDPSVGGASSLLYSTYLGGSDYDVVCSIAADNNGTAYVAGHTSSADFPTLNQYQAYLGGTDLFITKLDTTKSGTASLLYSTYLGGDGGTGCGGMVVDAAGYVYVGGWTHSWNYPIHKQYQGNNYGIDAIVSKLDTRRSGAASLVYSTYLGGRADDGCHGVAVDAGGNVYLSGGTSSADFPIKNGYRSVQENIFVSKLSFGGQYCFHGSDYDGDGDTDIAIFRPSTGRWCVKGSPSVAWGTSGDIPVPGDYDGDGDTDIAIFRPSTGRWCVMGQPSVSWGTSTDIPVPGDYDGDGDTDIAIFRPSTGRWCIMGQPSVAWGVASDIPVPADYDGDGDTDIAVFRASIGRWCIMGQSSIGWGIASDVPVPADYDGDGDADIAVYRPSIGRWCIMGQPSIAWGTSTDIAVPADYDGDGDDDIAIFRPSNGRWAIMGVPSQVYGTATDVPLVSHKGK